jgi:hypothetical protein
VAVLACAGHATVASAHVGTVTVSCQGVTFSYSGFTATQTTALETVLVDPATAAQTVTTRSFTFSGASATDTIPLSLSGMHTLLAYTTWDGTGASGQQTLTCGSAFPAPPCPAGTKANFRFHYAANGKAGSWSKTVSVSCPGTVQIGPQAMGDLKLAPGTTLQVGYSLTLPGNKLGLFLTVGNPQVVFITHCTDKKVTPAAPTFTVTMPTQPFAINDAAWYPSGDQKSPLVYQGSIAVPDLCAGGQVHLDKGGTFIATVT